MFLFFYQYVMGLEFYLGILRLYQDNKLQNLCDILDYGKWIISLFGLYNWGILNIFMVDYKFIIWCSYEVINRQEIFDV